MGKYISSIFDREIKKLNMYSSCKGLGRYYNEDSKGEYGLNLFDP